MMDSKILDNRVPYSGSPPRPGDGYFLLQSGDPIKTFSNVPRSAFLPVLALLQIPACPYIPLELKVLSSLFSLRVPQNDSLFSSRLLLSAHPPPPLTAHFLSLAKENGFFSPIKTKITPPHYRPPFLGYLKRHRQL